MKVSVNDRAVARILDAASNVRCLRGHDSYVVVREFKGPMNLDSYYSGGSIDEFCIVELATMRPAPLKHRHPSFEGDGKSRVLDFLPEGYVVVEGGMFRGKKAVGRIHATAANLTKLLPEGTGIDLSTQELTCLKYLASMRSCPERKERLARNGFEDIKSKLQDLGLINVNKAGAVKITIAGRNAVEGN